MKYDTRVYRRGNGLNFAGLDYGHKLRSRYSTKKDGDTKWYEVVTAYGHNVFGGIGRQIYEPTWYMLWEFYIANDEERARKIEERTDVGNKWRIALAELKQKADEMAEETC